MRSYRSKRLAIIIGAVCAITGGVWLLVVARNEGTPLRPWQPLWTTTAKPAPATVPPLVVKTEERAEPEQRPAVSMEAPVATPSVASAPVANMPESAEPVTEPQVPQSAAPSSSVFVQTQVEGTRIMYMAHASLRAPEVADPDSASNRQILQSMVSKAFRSSQTKP